MNNGNESQTGGKNSDNDNTVTQRVLNRDNVYT